MAYFYFTKSKKMKIILVSVLMALISFTGYSQDRKLDLSYSMGAYSTPYYDMAQRGLSYAVDFDYLLSNGWYISSGFTIADFDYYEPPWVENPSITVVQEDGTNGTVYARHINLKVKKDLFAADRYNVRVGLGFSVLTQSREYPLVDVFGPGSVRRQESSFTTLAFPLSVEPFYVLADRWRVGIRAELYVEPDFPLMGYNVGPQIRLRL